MKIATITTLLGYIILILLSIYGIFKSRYLFEYAGESFSAAMFIADIIVSIIPNLCYAIFFVFVLSDKLNIYWGIAGAVWSYIEYVIGRCALSGLTGIDYSLFSTWFTMITSFLIVFLMLLYFCNLKLNWVSMKFSSIGACVAFGLGWCHLLFILAQDSLLAQDSQQGFTGTILIINLVANMMASTFFFAMTTNILKNGK